jgi:hypothetical protein
MIRAISTAFAAVFLCLPAAAQECLPLAALEAEAIASVPQASVKERFGGDAAQNIVAAYNAIEPVSNDAAENVVVIQAPSVPVYLVIGYTGNCVVFAHSWNRGEYDALRKSGV